MMKGFIKILEAMLASVILLASVSYFMTSVSYKPSWDDVYIKIQTRDVLMASYRNGSLLSGIQSNNINETYNTTSGLSKSMDFVLGVDGIPNTQINLGCNCTTDEINILARMLWPLNFSFRNRIIRIAINPMSLSNIDPKTNVLFIFGYKDLKPFRNKINTFLDNGGTILVISDLNWSQVNDGIFNETFGLVWNGTLALTTSAIYNTTDPDKSSYYIAKNFVDVPVRVNTSSGSGEFYLDGIQYTIQTWVNATTQVSYVKYLGNNYTDGEIFETPSAYMKVFEVDGNNMDDQVDGYSTFADIGIVNKTYSFNTG